MFDAIMVIKVNASWDDGKKRRRKKGDGKLTQN